MMDHNTTFLVITHLAIACVAAVLTWHIKEWWQPSKSVQPGQRTIYKKTDNETSQKKNKISTYVFMPNDKLAGPEVYVTQHGWQVTRKFHISPECPTLHQSNPVCLRACSRCKNM